MKYRIWFTGLVVLVILAAGTFIVTAQRGDEFTIYPLANDYEISFPSAWEAQTQENGVLTALGQDFGAVVYEPGIVSQFIDYDDTIIAIEFIDQLVETFFSSPPVREGDPQVIDLDGREAAYIDLGASEIDMRFVVVQMNDRRYGALVMGGLPRWHVRERETFHAILASFNNAQTVTTAAQITTPTRAATVTSSPSPTPTAQVLAPVEGVWRIDIASVDSLALCRSGFERFGAAVGETTFTNALSVTEDGAQISFGSNTLNRVGETAMYIGTITTTDWSADIEVSLESSQIMSGRITSVINVLRNDDVCVDQVRVLISRAS